MTSAAAVASWTCYEVNDTVSRYGSENCAHGRRLARMVAACEGDARQRSHPQDKRKIIGSTGPPWAGAAPAAGPPPTTPFSYFPPPPAAVPRLSRAVHSRE